MPKSVKLDPHDCLFAMTESFACHVVGVSNLAPPEEFGSAHFSKYAEASVAGEFRLRPVQSVVLCGLRAGAPGIVSQRLPGSLFDARKVTGNLCWADTMQGAFDALGRSLIGSGAGQVKSSWLDEVVVVSAAILKDPTTQKLLMVAVSALVSAVERASQRDVPRSRAPRSATLSDVIAEVQKAMEGAVSIAELERLRQMARSAESRVTARFMALRISEVSARARGQQDVITKASAPRLRLVQA